MMIARKTAWTGRQVKYVRLWQWEGRAVRGMRLWRGLLRRPEDCQILNVSFLLLQSLMHQLHRNDALAPHSRSKASIT